MKDHQDTAKRGRPATGQALSNAERQRLWRERQKAQREELARALERIAELEAGGRGRGP